MCCHKEGVTQGLLSTVAKPIEDHPKSDVHSRKTRAAVEGQLALSGPVVLEDMTAAQLMTFLATGSPESAPAASGAISALGPRLIQADLGDVGVIAGGTTRDESIRALVAGYCTSLGLPPYTAVEIFSQNVLNVSREL